jgi:N,N'-diacetyllegionaminate synthase
MKSVQLGNKSIGEHFPVYIIAEIGGNFVRLKEAKQMIDLAVRAGADAIKIQTFRADTITSKKAVYDMPNTGHANQYELFKKYEIDMDLHKALWGYCKQKGIFVFSTPSHWTDLELLEKVGCEAYKIGSDDSCNHPFLEQVASVGKPIVLSTGMCTMQEVEESVSVILGKGNPNLALLHCVTNYPSDPIHSNLKVIPEMKRRFGLPVGYSDHTQGNLCCLAAVALGAHAVEKHFTYDKKADGPDHLLSANPEEMMQLCKNVRILEKALGDGVKRPSEGELTTRINNRKSIVSRQDIQKGKMITKDMIAIKRPGFGIQPKFFQEITGRVAKVDIKAESPVLWDYV